MNVLPAGARACLIEVSGLDEMLALYRGLEASRAARPTGIVDVTPAARTLLVEFDPELTSQSEIGRLAASVDLDRAEPEPRQAVTIEATYDGPDLDAVCEVMEMSREKLVAWHTRVRWRVAFTGFAPGFGYLVSPEHLRSVPRLPEPRTRVPAGSVAMADGFTGIYPVASPGGWRIIGTTTADLFDPRRVPAATLTPGRSVRFVERS